MTAVSDDASGMLLSRAPITSLALVESLSKKVTPAYL